jgi:drug/metabolite transporter (DMT)-like permease
MKNKDAVDSEESPPTNTFKSHDLEVSPLLKNNFPAEYNTIKEAHQNNNDNSIDYNDSTSKFDLVKGLFFMLLSCIFKSLFSIFSKYSLQDKSISSFQLLSFRTYFMFWISIISLFLFNVNVFSEKVIPKNKIFPIVIRTIFSIISMSLLIYAVKFMSISDVYSIYYVYPALIILFGMFTLGEKVGKFDYVCLVTCFTGVILIVKPDFLFKANGGNSHNTVFFTFVFVAAVLKALEDIIVRNMGKEVHCFMVPVFYCTLGMLLFPIPMIIFDKTYPILSLYQIVVLFFVGLFTFLYQTFMSLGLQYENAGRVSMVNYLQVALMYASDLMLFGKPFSTMELTGTLLIFSFNFINGIFKAMKRLQNLNKFKEKNMLK